MKETNITDKKKEYEKERKGRKGREEKQKM